MIAPAIDPLPPDHVRLTTPERVAGTVHVRAERGRVMAIEFETTYHPEPMTEEALRDVARVLIPDIGAAVQRIRARRSA